MVFPKLAQLGEGLLDFAPFVLIALLSPDALSFSDVIEE
jgi:hypothetical protein